MNDTSKQRNCAAHVHTHIHIHRHTCAHTHTRTHLVPRFTCGQQVSHKQWTRPVLSCWQLTRLSTPPPPKHTHRHVHPALTHKYPSHSTHTHTRWHVLVLTGWQRGCWLFTPTRLHSPAALSSINLSNVEHKHAHTVLQAHWHTVGVRRDGTRGMFMQYSIKLLMHLWLQR